MEIAVLLMVFGLRTFIAEPFSIPSNSMHPTLSIGDHVIAAKFGYGNYDFFGIDIANTRRHRSVNRGDVMVFVYPRDPKLEFIKRVVGLPGENIRYENKRVFVNDKELPRVQKSNDLSGSNYSNTTQHSELLNEKSYDISINNDSRPRPDINVTVPEGHYFVLGDNRDNSNDSRYWGFVPEENLIGKLVYILP